VSCSNSFGVQLGYAENSLDGMVPGSYDGVQLGLDTVYATRAD